MSDQLRASLFVMSPSGEEVQVMDEIPIFVRSDPGTLTLHFGGATVTFNKPDELIAVARLSAL